MAEAITADLTAKQERMTQQMAVDRTTAVKELQQYKDRVAEKDRAIKPSIPHSRTRRKMCSRR